MVPIPPISTQRGRRIWVAIALCVVSPSLAMLYLGRGWRAVFYFVASFASVAVAIALAANGYWKEGISNALLNGILTLIGIVDSYRIARGLSAEFPRPWYARWQGIAGVALTAVVCILCFRGFAYEPYRIPSGAMLPGLQIGDFILVNKWQYGVRLPFVHYMLAEIGLPQRGDVVVFRHPLEPGQNYIKRIVGLPGDQIQYVDRALVINGLPVERQLRDPFLDGSRYKQHLQFEEHLGNASYSVIYAEEASTPVHPAARHTDRQACTYADGGVSCTVPPQCYFVLGDNRDNSEDSRYWGFVPARNVVGRVFIVWWNDRVPSRAWTVVR